MHRSTVLLILLAAPPALPAQAPRVGAGFHAKPGQFIRLRTVDGRRLEGWLGVAAGGAAALQLASPDTLIPAAAIDSLWARGNAAGTGAIVGAIALGAPSLVLWTFVCGILNESGGCDRWELVAVYTAAGAGAGAVMGAAVGLLIPRWRLRYARTAAGLSVVPLPDRRLGVGVSLARR